MSMFKPPLFSPPVLRPSLCAQGISSCIVLENMAGEKALAVTAMNVRRVADSSFLHLAQVWVQPPCLFSPV